MSKTAYHLCLPRQMVTAHIVSKAEEFQLLKSFILKYIAILNINYLYAFLNDESLFVLLPCDVFIHILNSTWFLENIMLVIA